MQNEIVEEVKAASEAGAKFGDSEARQSKAN